MSDPTPWRAIGLMLVGMCCIPAGDGVAKVMIGQYDVSPGFVVWARFLVGAVCVLPFLKPETLPPRAILDWRLLLRGLLLAGTVGSITQAVALVPLATVFGAFFVGPILSYFLSVLFLGERIGRLQTLLLFVGFGGVLLVVRPGAEMEVGALFAVLAGVFYGAFLTTGRWLRSVAPPITLLFMQLVVAMVATVPLAIGPVPAMTWVMLLLLLFSGLFSLWANMLILNAYRTTEATRLAPFVYMQLVAATVYGVAFFGEVPDAMTFAGLLLLIGSGFGSLALKRGA
ncbi:MAG: DMT family transporter [Pseudomonadota bacterium]